MKIKTHLLLLLILISNLGASQNNCNISSSIPDIIFYAGSITNFTCIPPTQLCFYLCNNAVVYDTLAGNCTSERVVMIGSGAKYVWKRCGTMASSIHIKTGGTLTLLPEYFPTSTAIVMEPGAILNVMPNNTLYDTVICSQILFPPINCANGINEMSLERQITIYPNPSKNDLTILLSNNYAVFAKTYIITDSFGRKIQEDAIQGSATTIQTSLLPPGIYQIRIDTDHGTMAKKFVKMN